VQELRPGPNDGEEPGKLNQGYIERVLDWLVQEIGGDPDLLNPELYKKYMIEIFPYTEYDTFIDYLIDIGWLPPK
jgi:hypothetical protein